MPEQSAAADPAELQPDSSSDTIDLTTSTSGAPPDAPPAPSVAPNTEAPEAPPEAELEAADETAAPAGEEQATGEAVESMTGRPPGMATPPEPPEAAPVVSEAMPPSDVGPDVVASVTGTPTATGDLSPVALPRVVAIANQKGGVGKTTTAVNLGAALAELDHRVLVVDLDPQGNATTGLGINARDLEHSIYDVITAETPVEDCIESTSLRNLFLVPATIDLSGAEIELVPAFSRELKLRRALEPVKDDYDFTIIDCPPSLGLLTINGLAAADDVIVPIQCEYYALEGLGQLLRNVSLVRSSLNPTLEVRGIVLTMYDGRTRLAEQVESEVRKHFGPIVYDTVIPRTVRLGEAPSFGQPIIVFDPTSRGATTYRSLAQEVSDGTAGRTG